MFALSAIRDELFKHTANHHLVRVLSSEFVGSPYAWGDRFFWLANIVLNNKLRAIRVPDDRNFNVRLL